MTMLSHSLAHSAQNNARAWQHTHPSCHSHPPQSPTTTPKAGHHPGGCQQCL